ncbi:MAG: xylF [Conexibacter sp.]|nr:xylF [Conexibacter sp.]
MSEGQERDGLSRRRFLRGAGLLVAGSSTVGLLAACGSGASGGSGGGGGKTVALLLPRYTQKRWQVGDQAAFEAEAAKLGLHVIVQVANDDETLQASQADNVLTQGIDVLVLASVNADTSKTIVQKAKAQGVPVVSYNFLVSGADIDVAVGRDDVAVGRDLGRAALAAAPKGNYVLVFGDQATSVARDKAKGQMQVLKPAIDRGDIKIVSERFTKDWAPDLAQKQVEDALTVTHNQIAAVVTSYDGMAYGAIQALGAQGLAGKAFVSGEDGELEALRDIKRGALTVTSFTPFNEMGRAAAQAAAALAAGRTPTASGRIDNGKKTVPFVAVKAFNVSKHNLDQFVAANPWWVKRGEL